MLPDDLATAAAREFQSYVPLLRINTASPLRLAVGVGLFSTTAGDALDPSAIYRGVGMVGSLPGFRQLVGGTAEKLSIGLSGVDEVPHSYVDDDASDIIGAEVNIGLLYLDSAWQVIGDALWLWSGAVDQVTSEFSGGRETVTLSAGSEFVDRSRAAPRYWSDNGHRARHPSDTFCKMTSRYSEGTTIKWPG